LIGTPVSLVASKRSGDASTSVYGFPPNRSLSGSFFQGRAGADYCVFPLERGQTAAVQIRVHLRPCAVVVDLPRNCLTFNGLHIFRYSHVENPTISAKTAKTYGRFFGMIFSEGQARRLSLKGNRLRRKKPQKNEKTQNKMVNSLRPPPFFRQHGLKMRFLAVFGGIQMMVKAWHSFRNPERIASFSPGLARFPEGLPWVNVSKIHNPERVE
jgi:hypothetical protein